MTSYYRLAITLAAAFFLGELTESAHAQQASKPAATKPPTSSSGPASKPAAVPWEAMPFKRTDEGALKRHEEFLQRGKQGPIGVLFIGDSITAGWHNQDAWKKDLEPLNPVNFGISSDTPAHVLWRISEGGELDGIDAKAVVLLIGTNGIGGNVNNVSMAVTRVVKIIRQKLPHSQIVLMAIFPRAQANDKPTVMENVKAVNAIIAKLDDGKNIHFVDIGDKLAPGGVVTKDVFPDGVHLTPKGYKIWAESITPLLKTILQSQTQPATKP